MKPHYGPQVIRGTGKLEMIQLEQLAWWQAQADDWKVYFDLAPNGTYYLRCEECGASIMALSRKHIYYKTALSELTAQVVAHIRKSHQAVLDPEGNHGG